jgi:hypothetical protein
MSRFRKRPVVIEAERYEGGRTLSSDFVGADYKKLFYNEDGTLTVRTLEGDMKASPGDWIILGVKGELYPCKPDIFTETYERVDLAEAAD